MFRKSRLLFLFSLTAWPLIRDVFFYSVSLIVLVVFFLDNQIEWWEALTLFLWYGAYVSFMKFNEPAEDAFRSCLKMPPSVSLLKKLFGGHFSDFSDFYVG